MEHNLVVSALVLGAVFAVIVFAYGFVMPMLLGKPRHMMEVMDVVLLALFIAVVVFVMKTLGLWDALMMHL